MAFGTGSTKLDDNEATTTINVLKGLLKWRTQIVMTNDNAEADLPEDGEVAIATPAQCIEIADSIISICDIMAAYIGGKGYKKIQTSSDKMKATVEKKSSTVTKQAEKMTGTNGTAWRIVASIPQVWGGWATQTQAQLQGHLMMVGRASVELCNKSLSLYK